MVHSQNWTTFGTAEHLTAKAGVLQGIDLATAAFSRHGANLAVATADDRSTMVEGWFGHDHSAALDLGDGRPLPFGLVNSLAIAGTPAQYVQAGKAAPLQVIGRIDKVTGSSHSGDFVQAQHELTTIPGFNNDHLDLSNALFSLGASGNSYQIAHVDNVTAASVEAADFKLVS